METYPERKALEDCAKLWKELWLGPNWRIKHDAILAVNLPENLEHDCPCCEYTAIQANNCGIFDKATEGLKAGSQPCRMFCPLASLFKGNCERGLYRKWRRATCLAEDEKNARAIAKRIYFSAIANLRRLK